MEMASAVPRGNSPNDAGSMDSAVELAGKIALRNGYYRDGWRQSWRVIYMLLGVLAMSVGLNVFQLVKREQPIPFAVDPEGRVMEITPLSKAFDSEAVRAWAARTIPSLYSLNFREYRDQLNLKSKMFTKPGYDGYLEAIKRFGLVEDIVKNNYLVYATPKDAFTIVSASNLNGIPMWTVRAPLVVTFDNGTTPVSQNITLTAYIVRVPQNLNPSGLAIHAVAATRS